MTYSSRTTRSERSQRSEMYEFHEMKDTLNSRPQENRLFDCDPRHTIRMNRSRREELGPRLSLNEELSIDVQVLNHCFGDIERFVFKLQQASESSREMEKKKNSKDKSRESIYGLAGYYARSPSTREFTDIFQKFKLSINLLTQLKPHIHDPSSLELIHFLFTPLSLIFEASRDPSIRHINLSQSAISPMLTTTAKQFLMDNLTFKETELWRVLGRNWTMTNEEWKGLLPLYTPRFYNGWQPYPGRPNSCYGSNRDLRTAVMSKAAQARILFQREMSGKRNECPSDTSSIYCRINDPLRASRGNSFNGPILPSPRPDTDKPNPIEHDNSFIDVHMFDKGFIEEQPSQSTSGCQQHTTFSNPGEPSVTINSIAGEVVTFSSCSKQSELATLVKPISSSEPTVQKTASVNVSTFQQSISTSVPTTEKPISVIKQIIPDYNVTSNSCEDRCGSDPLIIDGDTSDFIQELTELGLKACEVVHDRIGGNTKELSLKKGDIVGLLDNSKNWWKVRNQEGIVGFAPYTILNILNENDERLVYKL